MKDSFFSIKAPYSRFSDDAKKVVISRPNTPAPLVNILSTGSYGVAFSQTGAGYAWRDGMNDLPQGPGGETAQRYLYIQDMKTGKYGSVGWIPVRQSLENYECYHGIGYSMITSQYQGIQSQWFAFVPNGQPLEVWRLRITNKTRRARQLRLWSCMSWEDRAPGLEARLFSSVLSEDKKTILLRKRATSSKKQKPSESFLWHGSNRVPQDLFYEKAAFLGETGSFSAPARLHGKKQSSVSMGRTSDGVVGFGLPISLKPGEQWSVLLTAGMAQSQAEAFQNARAFQNFSRADKAWNQTEAFWDRYLSALPIQTADKKVNHLINAWVKYRALSTYFWTRKSYDEKSPLVNQLPFQP